MLAVFMLVFLATVFMWPDTVYRMNGNIEFVRKATGGLFSIILLLALFGGYL